MIILGKCRCATGRFKNIKGQQREGERKLDANQMWQQNINRADGDTHTLKTLQWTHMFGSPPTKIQTEYYIRHLDSPDKSKNYSSMKFCDDKLLRMGLRRHKNIYIFLFLKETIIYCTHLNE